MKLLQYNKKWPTPSEADLKGAIYLNSGPATIGFEAEWFLFDIYLLITPENPAESIIICQFGPSKKDLMESSMREFFHDSLQWRIGHMIGRNYDHKGFCYQMHLTIGNQAYLLVEAEYPEVLAYLPEYKRLQTLKASERKRDMPDPDLNPSGAQHDADVLAGLIIISMYNSLYRWYREQQENSPYNPKPAKVGVDKVRI